MTSLVSFDGGETLRSVKEISERFIESKWDSICKSMSPEILEVVYHYYNSQSNKELLKNYLAVSGDNLIIDGGF